MKIKKWIERIPRPFKACLCAACCLIALTAVYIFLGCPTLSIRQEFRRAEKVNMVGPSKIIDTLNGEYIDFEKLIVGETDYGICFFGRYGSTMSGNKHSGKRHYLFTYREKTGDLTLAATPNVFGPHWRILGGVFLPVYLFDEYPEAARASVTITVNGEFKKNDVAIPINKTFEAEARREKEGHFRFHLAASDEVESQALYYISQSASGSDSQNHTATITATVELYDAQGNLITERDMEISP